MTLSGCLIGSARRSCTVAVAVAVVSLLGRPASATTIYFQGWNTPGDTAGWVPDVANANVSVPAAGGNPGGYLDMTSGPTFQTVGGVANFAPVNGNYVAAGVDGVSFDLNEISGVFTQAAFRVRYQNSGFNGWYHPVTYAPAGGWQSFSISFDPTWSDAVAMANGWIADGPLLPGSQVNFATTMSNVFNPEIRLDGIGFALHAGLDNFALDARVSTVPEPASLLLVGTGVALAKIRRRKQNTLS